MLVCTTMFKKKKNSFGRNYIFRGDWNMKGNMEIRPEKKISPWHKI